MKIGDALHALDDAGPPEPVVRRVTRTLREAIVTMRLAPGEKLSEQAIAHQLGTSRQPVREAFIRLAEIGLVRVLPQRGTMVVRISQSGVLDAHFVRNAVECALVREAARLAPAASIVQLRANMTMQRQAARARDGRAFFAADEAFHQLLAEAAGRTAAWRVVEEVKPQLDRIRFVNMGEAQRRSLVLRQHAAILLAVRAGDQCAASDAMRAHLANVPNSLPGLRARRPDLFELEADG